jgi:hypothetical protein
MKNHNIIFEEKQYFRHTWLLYVVLITTIPTVLLLSYEIYQQLVLGQSFRNNPISDQQIKWLMPLIIFAVIAPLVYFTFAYLYIAVTDKDICIKFFPFKTKTISFENIVSSKVRKYDALREYGGWGVRYCGKLKKAYIVDGKYAIELYLRDGQSLLLSTKHPAEFAKALQQQSVSVSPQA